MAMYEQQKGEEKDMASIALDYWEDFYLTKGRTEGRAEGETRGRAEGIEATKEENALTMFADHLPLEKVVKYSNLTLPEAEAIGKRHGCL